MAEVTAPGAGSPLLDVRDLRKVYAAKTGPVEAIHELSFAINSGDFACLVGPSGAGKTTLLKCIAGLLEITSGQVRLEDRAVAGPPLGMAVVFQEYGRSLFPWMSVQRNVELPLQQKRVRRARRRELVARSLADVGLSDVAESYPWQLSGGMQQRVAIARAIAYEPHILLMDEPFAAVDAQTRAELEDLIRVLWQRLGMTILFVTHDIDESVYLGQHVLVLSGRPTVLMADVPVTLGEKRDQLTTRSDRTFAELRAQVYSLIQQAKDYHAPSEAPAGADLGKSTTSTQRGAPADET